MKLPMTLVNIWWRCAPNVLGKIYKLKELKSEYGQINNQLLLKKRMIHYSRRVFNFVLKNYKKNYGICRYKCELFRIQMCIKCINKHIVDEPMYFRVLSTYTFFSSKCRNCAQLLKFQPFSIFFFSFFFSFSIFINFLFCHSTLSEYKKYYANPWEALSEGFCRYINIHTKLHLPDDDSFLLVFQLEGYAFHFYLVFLFLKRAKISPSYFVGLLLKISEKIMHLLCFIVHRTIPFMHAPFLTY